MCPCRSEVSHDAALPVKLHRDLRRSYKGKGLALYRYGFWKPRINMTDRCCGCGKTIDVRALEARQRRALVAVLAINLLTFLLMVAGAWYSRSSSLLSGALDILGDALT